MANKHARLMIYRDGVSDVYAAPLSIETFGDRFADLFFFLFHRRRMGRMKLSWPPPSVCVCVCVCVCVYTDNKINRSRNDRSNLLLISGIKGHS